MQLFYHIPQIYLDKYLGLQPEVSKPGPSAQRAQDPSSKEHTLHDLRDRCIISGIYSEGDQKNPTSLVEAEMQPEIEKAKDARTAGMRLDSEQARTKTHMMIVRTVVSTRNENMNR